MKIIGFIWYEKIIEYRDKHDLAEQWEETKPAELEVDIQSEITYYAVDNELSAKVQALARSRILRRFSRRVRISSLLMNPPQSRL